MKKIMFFLVVIAATISMVSFAPKAKNADVVNFKVTAQKSKVDFTGSKKSDYHTGYFPIKSGAVQVNDGKLVGGSFVIDIAGLKVTDAGGGEKLQGHLSSVDFFDIAKLGFGEASFTISSVGCLLNTFLLINNFLIMNRCLTRCVLSLQAFSNYSNLSVILPNWEIKYMTSGFIVSGSDFY